MDVDDDCRTDVDPDCLDWEDVDDDDGLVVVDLDLVLFRGIEGRFRMPPKPYCEDRLPNEDS